MAELMGNHVTAPGLRQLRESARLDAHLAVGDGVAGEGEVRLSGLAGVMDGRNERAAAHNDVRPASHELEGTDAMPESDATIDVGL